MVHQSFVMTKVCYLYLPRPQFTSLQKKVFPLYFGIQTALSVATAVTYPGGSIPALLTNRTDVVLLAITVAMSLLNLVVYGPRTTEAMVQRSHQGMQPARHRFVVLNFSLAADCAPLQKLARP